MILDEAELERMFASGLTPKDIAEAEKALQGIKSSVDYNQRQQRHLWNEYHEAMKPLEAELKAIQGTCPHTVTRVQYDQFPGPSESWYVCQICGKKV